MKKLLLLVAVCLTLTSCKWWHETFDDTNECAVWYVEQMYEADDLDDFEDIANDFYLWMKDLGKVEQWKAEKALDEWSEENEKKSEKIDKRFKELNEKYTDNDK